MAKVRTIFKPPRIRKKAAAWEKAYIVALVDAKASLAINPRQLRARAKQQLVTIVSLYGHDIKELRMVQERYGGIIKKFVDRLDENFISIYRLEISRKKDIVFLITDISRYLIAKSKQADLLLKYCQSRLEAWRGVECSFLAPVSRRRGVLQHS